ncbi:MAG TPA: DUF5671 domain-containing protein [Acidobacteriaceae bacterium]|nr:DUF5671 domain-containing protein [Acidobacteriaceae bacterium]
MSRDNRVAEFIQKSLDAGIPVPSFVGLLTARGWTEKQAYSALADHYQRQTGIEVPPRPGSGASARDAFFYLLIFSTLSVWTLSLGCLAFSLIDRWLADPLFQGYGQTFSTYSVTTSLAAIIVAFPLYLLVSRVVLREAAADPDKLDSGIRKWLTYMALVIAASVFMGDLIAALAYLLRGELSSVFLAKSLVVLLVSTGVFWYYFGGLRRVEAAGGPFSRDRLMAVMSATSVVIMIALGFGQLGAPNTQRKIVADNQRVQQLYKLSSAIRNYWQSHSSQLPASLTDVPGTYTDPITHQDFEYHPAQGSQYQLCADFAARSPWQNGNQQPRVDPDAWTHSAGRHCFLLDASALPQQPSYNYPY